MNFTYSAYEEMLRLLKQNNYDICNYENYKFTNRCVILRHDIDFSLEAALRFAELEYKNGVYSTYFVLLSTCFYNPFYRKAYGIIKEIRGMGHDIGLHFDEARYSISDEETLIYYVEKEASVLSQGLDMEINVVSMHRPSKWVLERNVQFNEVINSYSREFFNEFKYLSDSRMHWREDIYQVIETGRYERLHILTHPIWYCTKEFTMREVLMNFIKDRGYKLYDSMRDNIRDLNEVLLRTDIQ